MKMYRLHDVKSGQYHWPIYAQTDGAAIREIQRAMQEPTSMLHTNPEDFYLWRVGECTDTKPDLSTEVPVRLFNLADLKE